jgi:two-component system sensor histidine kinase KdpD
VRYARRLADHLHAPWTALYIETARHHRLSDVERDRISDCLRLAQRLGGEALTIPGSRVVDEVLAYAEENNITQVVVGKSDRSRWFEMMHGSVVHDLVRRAGQMSVLVMSGDEAELLPAKTVKTKPPQEPFAPGPYISSLGVISATLLAGLLIKEFFGVANNIALVFLAGILLVAARWGLGPSLVACAAGVLAFNFFFLPPLYTFHHRRSRERGDPVLFRHHRHPGQQSDRADARPGGHRAKASEVDRGALRLQPEAGRHRRSRRPSVGDGTSGRLDAQSARRPAASG